jgi:hypothetical protein
MYNIPIIGLITAAFLYLVMMVAFFPQKTPPYHLGVSDTHKEAFEKGYMEKVITQDDKVIYKWKESK